MSRTEYFSEERQQLLKRFHETATQPQLVESHPLRWKLMLSFLTLALSAAIIPNTLYSLNKAKSAEILSDDPVKIEVDASCSSSHKNLPGVVHMDLTLKVPHAAQIDTQTGSTTILQREGSGKITFLTTQRSGTNYPQDQQHLDVDQIVEAPFDNANLTAPRFKQRVLVLKGETKDLDPKQATVLAMSDVFEKRCLTTADL